MKWEKHDIRNTENNVKGSVTQPASYPMGT